MQPLDFTTHDSSLQNPYEPRPKTCWPFNKYETFFLTFYISYIGFEITQWPYYSTCPAPINIFLTVVQSTFLVIIISLILLNSPNASNFGRECIKRFVHFIITPLCMYLPVQGTIWQVRNIRESVHCPAVGWSSILIWCWILFSLLIGLVFTLISYLKLKNWWRLFQYRRQMRRLNQLAAQGDYQTLNEMLVDSEDMSNKVGLGLSDIEKLHTREFTQSVTDMLTGNDKETCPICFEDFKQGDKMTSLPRCDHVYHPKCITGWLLKVPLCPMCRANVRTGLYTDGAQGSDLENPHC